MNVSIMKSFQNRNCGRNFKWPFIHRVACLIDKGTYVQM